MQLASRLLTVGIAVVVVLSMVACASGPKAQAPPPTATPEADPSSRDRGVVEEEVTEPVTETLSTERVTSELPEDLAILNARGYLEDVFFATDRYDLSPEARAALATNSNWLLEFPSVEILVEGHCDERNTREYNLALGERRANAVREYLISLGIGPERIRTISYGEERPFALGSTEEAWRLNRRAHFVITGR
ncbi:MAG TPA: peptidoglycan-associated lipoprotein Pal [Candidatus Sulfomarinibacteraceae bacterium]|nr:peptidoglycan-associated lipoprotein Pal [Candidatus Sulfomarinibacteraceae bacterium]